MEGCARSVFFVRDACAICTVCARSVLFVRDFYSCVICARFVSFVHDIYYSCAIIMLFVRDIYYRVRSVRDLCAICASLCAPRAHDVFVGPGFEPLTMQYDLLQVPGSTPGSDRLCQASEIRGLCHCRIRVIQSFCT